MATSPSCAPGTVHIDNIHIRSNLESGLVLCDDSPWALTCFHRVQWVLEAIVKKKSNIKIVDYDKYRRIGLSGAHLLFSILGACCLLDKICLDIP